MRIISFAWTTPALLARQKTVTRRDWKDSYAKTFHKGELLQAWDRSPRTGKGRKIGIIRIKSIRQAWSNELNESDWTGEGFEYLTQNYDDREQACSIWNEWVDHPRYLWVVRFEIVSLEG